MHTFKKGVTMKKLTLVTLVLVLSSTFAFAAAFTPNVLTITGTDYIPYEFDGTSVEIPFTISTSATLFFVVTTKGKGANIKNVRNGNMGWHYVNKIDTTVYLSTSLSRSASTTSYIWDGKDKTGEQVQADEYYYYLWGFNNVNNRTLACNFMGIYGCWNGRDTHYFDYDVNGMPEDPPIIWGALAHFRASELNPIGTCMVWELGGDPLDRGLLQTTFVTGYSNPDVMKGLANRDSKNPGYFFYSVDDLSNQLTTLNKYQWVMDGEAKMVEGWGGWDNLTWTNPILSSRWSIDATMYTENEYLWPALTQTQAVASGQDSPLIAVDTDGNQVVYKLDTPGWYYPDHLDDDGNPAGFSSPPFDREWSRTSKNHWMLQAGSWNVAGYSTCLFQFADFTNILVDNEDNTDFIVWENRNGDYYLDTNTYPDAKYPWECWGFPDIVAGQQYDKFNGAVGEVSLDRYNFAFVTLVAANMQEVALFLPDGTGCGEVTKFSDTVTVTGVGSRATKYVMNGGKYDGLYCSGDAMPEMTYVSDNCYWAGADTFRGSIGTGETAVEENAVNAFSVAQNAPNPFNPTTTINFTIPKAGNVTMDVYNVAGQKVAALANGYMNAGTHSVVWNAAGFSAGVYFYTVKTGEFSKTMKMTLLK